MPSIKLPCSTANMGAGFDSIGMALALYNEIEFEVCESGLEIDVGDNQGFYIADDERNLVYRSIKRALSETGVPMPGLRIKQTNRIPQTRGWVQAPPASSAASLRRTSSATAPFQRTT